MANGVFFYQNFLQIQTADHDTAICQGLEQIFLLGHILRHDSIPPNIGFVLGRVLRTVGSPLMLQKLFAGITRQ